MNKILVLEDLLTLNVLLYHIDNVEGSNSGDFATRSVQKYKRTVRKLRYNHRICFVSSINAVFLPFRCPNCEILSKRTLNLEQSLTNCSGGEIKIFPRNVCQIRETLFDKLDSFRTK